MNENSSCKSVFAGVLQTRIILKIMICILFCGIATTYVEGGLMIL